MKKVLLILALVSTLIYCSGQSLNESGFITEARAGVQFDVSPEDKILGFPFYLLFGYQVQNYAALQAGAGLIFYSSQNKFIPGSTFGNPESGKHYNGFIFPIIGQARGFIPLDIPVVPAIYLDGGYSILLDWDNTNKLKGYGYEPVFGIGGGVKIPITEDTAVLIEMGYQKINIGYFAITLGMYSL